LQFKNIHVIISIHIRKGYIKVSDTKFLKLRKELTKLTNSQLEVLLDDICEIQQEQKEGEVNMNNTELYQNFESVVSKVKNGKAQYVTLDTQNEHTHKSFIVNYDDKGNFIELYSDIENPNVTSVLTSFYGGRFSNRGFLY